MATLTIKNVPERLYNRLKRSAVGHRRSVNSEVIECIERALGTHRIDPEEFLERARALRQQTPGLFVTEKDLLRAKREDRL